MNWFIIAFASALLSAAATISEKKVLFKMEALEFSFYVNILNLLFSLPFFFTIDFSNLSVISISILLIKSILGALAFLCVMLALKNLEISGALPLMVLTPALVAILAFIFLGDSISLIQIIGMLLLLIGTYLLEVKSRQSIIEPFKIFTKSNYYHYIGFALLLFTVSSILDKLLLGKYKLPPFTFLAFQQLFYAIIFLFIFLVKRRETVTKSFNAQNLFWIIFIAILTVGYRYTQIEAIKIAPVALVLSVKRISVFIAAIGGGKIFKESSLLKKAIATIIMVAGAILIMED